MGVELEANYSSQISKALLVFSIVGAVLLPPIKLSSNLPAIEISDLTFLILLIIASFYHRKQLLLSLLPHRKVIFTFLAFVGVVIVSIIINKRWNELRDWFEVLKYLKFLSFFLLSYFFFTKNQLISLFGTLLIAVFIFNILHYFNVANFNQIIEPYYSAPHHLDFFGLNSIGEPSTKRALGTLGNPNTNGLLFLLFTLIFLPRRVLHQNKNYLLVALAILGLFLCQSRTGILAYLLVLVVYYLTDRSNWRAILGIVLFSSFVYVLLALMGNLYLNSIGNPDIMKTAGIGRIEQWKKIITSMPGHWLIGHAPEKEYFEKHSIYSESEFFLLLFRYGLLGVFTFLTFWGVWLKEYVLNVKNPFKLGLFVAIVYLFSAITNNPLQSPKIALILAVIMALTLLEIDEQKKEG